MIRLLANQQAPGDVVRSAERLWATGKEPQRDAACELLRLAPGRLPGAVTAAEAFAAAGLTDRQREQLGELVGEAAGGEADDPGLGLFDPARRAPVPAPDAREAHGRGRFGSDAALRMVSALDDLAEKHRDTLVTVVTWQRATEMLLVDVRALSSPFGARRGPEGPDDEEGQGLVLGHVFRQWWAERPADCRDDERLDALRGLVAVMVRRSNDHSLRHLADRGEWWPRQQATLVGGHVGELRHAPLVRHVLSWLVTDVVSGAVIDECLDAVEAVWAAVPPDVVEETPGPPEPGERRWSPDWREGASWLPWLNVLRGLFARDRSLFQPEQLTRWFRLMRWLDEPRPGAARRLVDRRLLLAAHAGGGATDDDVLDQLVEPRSRLLADFTRRRRRPLEERHPAAVALADRVRERVVDLERRRGDLPTPTSTLACQLGSVSGTALTLDFLGRMGQATLVRQAYGTGREAVFSRLIVVSFPDEADTASTLRDLAKATSVTDKRLIELAHYAPQWARMVEQALDWPGLEDAVWWFHAHTRDQEWRAEADVREAWTALSAERTPLTARDLLAGAVDVDWFTRCHAALGEERWKVVHGAARFSSERGGHRRAQLFAEALSGAVDEATLMGRITVKRHQEAVAALGLLPLPTRRAERRRVVLRRYGALREFERGSAKFGSARQASERLAVRIAIDNLARTAGYPDPQRFVWAMEAAEAGALADGPVSVSSGEVTVTLSVTREGTPELSVRKGDRALKAVPAAARKAPAIAGLRDRKTALTRQATRVRAALESAMVRQDPFGEDDLAALDRHPIVAPMLRPVVYVDDAGQRLRRTDGQFVDVRGRPASHGDGLRLAHPADLAVSGSWIGWQEQLFVAGERQPFKQVFRELYTVTTPERDAGPGSRRYEGHQIQPRQAMALLTRRGWLAEHESGDVARVFHRHGVVARATFLDGFGSPAQVELPTLGEVYFTKPGAYLAQPLADVPPVVFSEAMRDLDLVVSVAHAGGVDPEASASTVEMRTALVRETTRLLKLGTVRIVGSHAVIEGVLGEYSVHLGSGVVHRRPGGAICIIPIHGQRRGRIFLPFADDDPKTAEVLAKVLLLADDKQIKDPTILEQLQS